MADRVGRDLAVRVEARHPRLLRQRVAHGLDLFLDAIAEHDAPPDAADRHRERGARERGARARRGLGRELGAADQAIEISLHELDEVALGEVAREGHRLLLVVDGEQGADEELVVLGRGAHGEREEQARRGEVRGLVAEVLFVEGERGLSIEREQDVALGAGDDALGAELVPAALGAVADRDVVAVEADRGDEAALDDGAAADPGALEARAVAGEAARDDDRGREHGVEAGDELAAVDPEALGEDQHAAEIRPLQGAGELLAGREGPRGVLDLD